MHPWTSIIWFFFIDFLNAWIIFMSYLFLCLFKFFNLYFSSFPGRSRSSAAKTSAKGSSGINSNAMESNSNSSNHLRVATSNRYLTTTTSANESSSTFQVWGSRHSCGRSTGSRTACWVIRTVASDTSIPCATNTFSTGTGRVSTPSSTTIRAVVDYGGRWTCR